MQHKVVTAAIIFRGAKVMLARRSVGEKLPGYWEFPGGKLEHGETLQEGLIREIYEEFQVHATVHEVIAESIYTYDHGSINLVGLRTEVNMDSAQLNVHDRLAWPEIVDLNKYKLAPADIPIADKLISNFQPD